MRDGYKNCGKSHNHMQNNYARASLNKNIALRQKPNPDFEALVFLRQNTYKIIFEKRLLSA